MFRSISIAAAVYCVVADAPPECTKDTPAAGKGKCSLRPPKDHQFAPICQPGAMGHAGGAEVPTNRCPRVNYTEGVFSCSCCGQLHGHACPTSPRARNTNTVNLHLLACTAVDHTGWPAFHSPPVANKNNASDYNICNPVDQDTEVVCTKCGAHLGDYFSDDDHYCVPPVLPL
eukprot:gene2916-3501_t